MSMLKNYERKVDAAKTTMDDLLTELEAMSEKFREIYDLAYDADEDNWKGTIDRIMSIAENSYL